MVGLYVKLKLMRDQLESDRCNLMRSNGHGVNRRTGGRRLRTPILVVLGCSVATVPAPVPDCCPFWVVFLSGFELFCIDGWFKFRFR